MAIKSDSSGSFAGTPRPKNLQPKKLPSPKKSASYFGDISAKSKPPIPRPKPKFGGAIGGPPVPRAKPKPSATLRRDAKAGIINPGDNIGTRAELRARAINRKRGGRAYEK